MLFNFKRPIYNQNIREYCLKSTNESIKKLIEKSNEERKNKELQLNLVTNYVPSNNPNLNNPYLPVLIFLSVTSFIYYFYNSKK